MLTFQLFHTCFFALTVSAVAVPPWKNKQIGGFNVSHLMEDRYTMTYGAHHTIKGGRGTAKTAAYHKHDTVCVEKVRKYAKHLLNKIHRSYFKYF